MRKEAPDTYKLTAHSSACIWTFPPRRFWAIRAEQAKARRDARTRLRAYSPLAMEPLPSNLKVVASPAPLPRHFCALKRMFFCQEFKVPEEEIKRAVERSQRYTPLEATAVKLEIFKTNDGRGNGVRTLRRIMAGQFVCEYAGENISEMEGKKREKEYIDKDAQDWYFFYYNFGSRRMCVDAMRDTYGTFGLPGFGRVINHSRLNPNLCKRVLKVPGVTPGLPRLFLFAVRDIEEGEELLIDYGDRDGKSVKNNPWLL